MSAMPFPQNRKIIGEFADVAKEKWTRSNFDDLNLNVGDEKKK